MKASAVIGFFLLIIELRILGGCWKREGGGHLAEWMKAAIRRVDCTDPSAAAYPLCRSVCWLIKYFFVIIFSLSLSLHFFFFFSPAKIQLLSVMHSGRELSSAGNQSTNLLFFSFFYFSLSGLRSSHTHAMCEP